MSAFKWQSLETYSPFAQILVEFMWRARPPLQPSQFARGCGVTRQQLSWWLLTQSVPPPAVIVRMARFMNTPVRSLLIAAGYATDDDPLFDCSDAWVYVQEQIVAAAAEGILPAPTKDDMIPLLQLVQAWKRQQGAAAGVLGATPVQESGHEIEESEGMVLLT